MSMEAEVLIVGAGPAGSALGLELARRGHDVLILERSSFPRDKPCGDCVNPGAVSQLHRLGIADRLYEKLSPVLLHGWRIQAPDGTAFEAEFGENESGAMLNGWAVRRRDFDAALLDETSRAGARVRFGVRVADVLRDRERVVGVLAREGAATREARASFVVGADGIRSVIQRRLGLRGREPQLRKIALVGHLAGGNGLGCLGELRVLGGRTCGYAALQDGANVTLMVPESEAKALAGRPREFFISALTEFPEIADQVRSRGLEKSVMVTGPFDQPVSRSWAQGAVLIGDAAGYYDPFTGQGVYQALLSAHLAAQAIDSALRDPASEARTFKRYDRRLRRELLPKRALQRAVETVISRADLMSWFLGGLAKDGLTAKRLLRTTADLDHPINMLDPVLWSRFLFLGAENTA